jgi:DNA polymerase I-like protein with 3'-5' exonuclease and polymerase domains/uracil-DNA glycosylase
MTPLPLYTGDVRAVVEQTPARSVSKDCSACELATTARTICTPGDGPEDAPVLVVLPGVSDAADRAGHVVAGTVPEWVARTLGAGGAAIRYEAAMRCRVGGSVPSDTMLHACRPYTAGSLPGRKRIIAVGQAAHRLLLGRALPLTVRRGIALLSDGTPVVMLGDPVTAMKNRLLRARYEDDLRWALAVEAPAAPWGLVTQVVDTAADSQAACDEARSWPWVALDAEWAGVIDDPDHTLLSIAIGTQGDRSFVWDRAGLADPAVAEPLRALLRDRAVTVVGHNAKADFRALRAWLGGWPRGKWTDTRMLRKVQDAESSGALDDLAETVGMGGHKAEARAALDAAKAKIRKGARKSAAADLFAERSDYGSMPRLYESLPRDVLLRYNARDTVATARLYVSELAALDADDPALRYVLEGLVVPATLAICRIEQAGVPCDPTGLGAVDALWAVEQQQIEARLVTASPNPWKPGSPRDVARVLYSELGLRCPGKTDSGAPSTDADALDKLKGQHPVVDDLIAWRKISKLRGTYSQGIAEEIRPDGRIRASFLLDGARTGRMSCNSPNLQQVPRGDTTSGKMLRDVFAARPGWSLVQADYSQLELRVAAGLARDEEMIAVFRSGVDYHLRTAQMISKQAWGIEPEEVTKVHRTATKAVNFGLLYGSDDRSLAETLGGTVADAAKVRAAVLGRFKGLAQFIQGCLRDARTTGGAWTVWRGRKARRRPLWGIADPDEYLRGHYERASWNTPIQGTGSDICLDALVEIVDWIEADGVPAELVLPIHDSLMIHCQDDALDEVIYQMRRIMESRWCGDCPLAVDVEVGKSWGSLEKLKK